MLDSHILMIIATKTGQSYNQYWQQCPGALVNEETSKNSMRSSIMSSVLMDVCTVQLPDLI